MKVFAVFSGYYSDRSLDAIFSTEEKAKAYIEMMQYNLRHNIDDSYEEYEIDSCQKIEYVYFSIEEKNKSIYPYKGFAEPDDEVSLDVNGNIVIKVKYNESEEVMEKAARDKYYIWKAHQEGIA